MPANNTWGLLPADIQALLLRREWQNETNRKARLLHQRPWPIRVNLKPPRGNSVIADLTHFQQFVHAWQQVAHPQQVTWQQVTYRTLSTQRLPTTLVLATLTELMHFLGGDAYQDYQRWQQGIKPLLAFNDALYPALVAHFNRLQNMDKQTIDKLITVLPQLHPKWGQGYYLRALPLVGVDTKFVETQQSLLTALLDSLHNNAVSAAGGLLPWLGCLEAPTDWLGVRPLCPHAQQQLGGLPLLQLPSHVLVNTPLPSKRILIVENKQAGLALPPLADTIAVFAGGLNVAWVKAAWLRDKQVGYWGDIDTWGLAILSEVRKWLPHVCALMMDKDTLLQHRIQLTHEPTPTLVHPENLTPEETDLFDALTQGQWTGSRLEQEYLHADYIATMLQRWVAA